MSICTVVPSYNIIVPSYSKILFEGKSCGMLVESDTLEEEENLP